MPKSGRSGGMLCAECSSLFQFPKRGGKGTQQKTHILMISCSVRGGIQNASILHQHFTHTHTHTHARPHARPHARTHTYTQTYIHKRTHKRTHTHTRTHTYTHVHIHTDIARYLYIFLYIYIYVCICVMHAVHSRFFVVACFIAYLPWLRTLADVA